MSLRQAGPGLPCLLAALATTASAGLAQDAGQAMREAMLAHLVANGCEASANDLVAVASKVQRRAGLVQVEGLMAHGALTDEFATEKVWVAEPHVGANFAVRLSEWKDCQ